MGRATPAKILFLILASAQASALVTCVLSSSTSYHYGCLAVLASEICNFDYEEFVKYWECGLGQELDSIFIGYGFV